MNAVAKDISKVDMQAYDISTSKGRKDAPANNDPRKGNDQPYRKKIVPGLFLLFYKPADDAGTWTWRASQYMGQHAKAKYLFESLGACSTMDYKQAVHAAQAWSEKTLKGYGLMKVDTVREVAPYYEAARQKIVDAITDLDKKARAQTSLNNDMAAFNNHVLSKPIADIPMEKITLTLLEEWQGSITRLKGDAPLEGDSIDRYWKVFSAVLQYGANKLRVVTGDISDEWLELELVGEGKAREVDLTDAQCEDWFAAMPYELGRLARFLKMAPLRPGAASYCKKKDLQIDKDGNARLWIEHDKVHAGRWVTLTPTMRDYLLEQAKSKLPEAYLFMDAAGQKWTCESWGRAAKKAAIETSMRDKTTIYCLRHIAITDLVYGGVKSFTVANFAGTSQRQIEKHYFKQREDEDRLAMVAAGK